MGPDVYEIPQQSERDKREGRIALWVVGVVFPFFMAWLLTPVILQQRWMRDAEAKTATLGYFAQAVNVLEIPCRRWFSIDYGYSVDYQRQRGETIRRGYLCREIGDEAWTWHPAK